MSKAVGLMGILAFLSWPGAEPSRAAPAREGLVACWDFDHFSGDQVPDQAGGDHPGTLLGASESRRVDGHFGSPALQFTGPRQEMTGPDAGLPTGASPVRTGGAADRHTPPGRRSDDGTAHR